MSNLIEDLRQFDLRVGKTPIDPTRIEGFGPGHAPAPTDQEPPPVPPASEMYGEPYDEPIGAPEPAVSPLVNLGRQAFNAPNVAGIYPMPVPPAGEPWELFVGDQVGRYKGWEVELLEEEQKQIIAVIHGAFRRRMEAQFESVTGRPMRRSRQKKVEAPKRRGKRGPAGVEVAG